MNHGLLLVGGGGHCLSAIEVIESAALPIAGIIHGNDCAFEPVWSYPALGRDGDLAALRQEYQKALVTVGQIKTPELRKRLFSLLTSLEFELPVIIASSAVVSRHAPVAAGTIVMHQAVVNSSAAVGRNCIINTSAIVEHGCTVADHCHIAVGALLCGDVSIGEGSFIGAGAIVRSGTHVGKGCIVGMGSKVLGNIPDGAVHVG